MDFNNLSLKHLHDGIQFLPSVVPLVGTNKFAIFVFSIVSNFIFLSIPPAYPVRLPFFPTTRWHGIMMDILLCPTAPPTACADIPERLFCFAISFAILLYVVVCPYGIFRRIFHTRNLKIRSNQMKRGYKFRFCT